LSTDPGTAGRAPPPRRSPRASRRCSDDPVSQIPPRPASGCRVSDL